MEIQIKISEDQIRHLVIEAIQKKFGVTITSDKIESKYTGNYEDMRFDGMAITITDKEFNGLCK